MSEAAGDGIVGTLQRTLVASGYVTVTDIFRCLKIEKNKQTRTRNLCRSTLFLYVLRFVCSFSTKGQPDQRLFVSSVHCTVFTGEGLREEREKQKTATALDCILFLV